MDDAIMLTRKVKLSYMKYICFLTMERTNYIPIISYRINTRYFTSIKYYANLR